MTRNTLMGKTKEELVDLVLMYENNQMALGDTIDQQYRNAVNLLNDMDLLNKGLEETREVIGEPL